MQLLTIAVALAASSVCAKAPLPRCDHMFGIGDVVYKPVLKQYQTALEKCFGFSQFGNAIAAGRRPSKAEISRFFTSDDCRLVVTALQASYRANSDACVVDDTGTTLGQLATLPFDELRRIYESSVPVNNNVGLF
ncbi:Aste57867_10474 [Aphanomyces stellatus]|uniref:Aste57867_10474 protein n=1 Tax=Aphanomyces stellatus TaxID=120398 RepID=A0A485KQG5_9STRA|nr:hypothetical protein As57867_010434 [Aphanomyces stellatus]VFT87348.1 Aste57867_10474 [Aphanomyces stellatus]